LTKMNGKFLLDSNIVIDIFRGRTKTIDKVKEIDSIYIPVIVLGELYFGANKSNQTPKRILEIEQLEKTVIILDITKITARVYGEIKEKLRAKGTLIPENDIWIASIAKENNLPIVTRDKHFKHVEGIKIVMI
jgi:tRNA(fMet)-specific endonuclease VapC